MSDIRVRGEFVSFWKKVDEMKSARDPTIVDTIFDELIIFLSIRVRISGRKP
jgi:hypothetical protein